MKLLDGSIFTAAEIEQFRAETAGCAFVNHLNNAGSGLMPDAVTNSVQAHIKLEAETGGYEAAAIAQEAINEFYLQAALLLHCKSTNVAFTSSATDSFTRALSSVPFEKGDVILTDTDGFISNQLQFISCRERFGIQIVHLENTVSGGVCPADLEKKLKDLRPRLLSITHIPTNSGLIQPVKEIGTIYNDYRTRFDPNTWYILDACQSAGQLPIDVRELHCDFLTVTNRKFLRGPRGTGTLFVSDRALEAGLQPLFIDMRGATWIEKDRYIIKPDASRYEDWEFAYSSVIGSSEAIKYCRAIGEVRIQGQLRLLAEYMRAGLLAIRGIAVLDRGSEQGALVTFTRRGAELKPMLDRLTERKINVVPSFRNFAVIDFDEKNVQWAIRASPHYYNAVEEIDDFLNTVKSAIIEKKF